MFHMKIYQLNSKIFLNKMIKPLMIGTSLATAFSPVFAKNAIEPVMVTIPAGSFEMGYEKEAASSPVHTVNLQQFSIGQYEVTVQEFRQFVEATGYQPPTECRHELDGWFKLWTKGNWEANNLNTSEFQPVVCINWEAADAYTKWLAHETGKPYRLPTEAEWEYAALAGARTDYFFGNDENRTQVCQYANTADLYGESILQRDGNTSYYNWTSGMQNCTDHSAYASIVGMYLPNKFGLYDVISNVQEMLADCYVRGYENAPNDGSARLDGECKRHSVRGGSWHWNNSPIAQRSSIGKDFSGGVDGFRIAMDGAAPEQSEQTKAFVKSLIIAQQSEQKRRDLRPEFPDAVTNLRLDREGNYVVLNWDKSNQADVKYYRVYRNALPGKMFKLLAANLTQTQYIDTTAGQHQYDYTVVAVRDYLQSHYANPVTTSAELLSIQSKIEAEWSHDFSGTAISWSDDNERGGHTLTGKDGISKGALISYQIEVPEPGLYDFKYRVASSRETRGFELYVDDKKAANYLVSDTGGYNKWQTQSGKKVYLKKGKNKLSFKSIDNHWKLNWFRLDKS